MDTNSKNKSMLLTERLSLKLVGKTRPDDHIDRLF